MSAAPSPTWCCATPPAPCASSSRRPCRPIPARASWACCGWPPSSSTCRSPPCCATARCSCTARPSPPTPSSRRRAPRSACSPPRAFAIRWRSAAASARTSGTTARRFPEVLAPRYLRLPVRGRIGADGQRAGAAGRRGRRRGGQGVRRGRRRIGRRLPVQFLPRRRARARGRRAARQELGGPMDLAVERGHADHGRVRAQLDRRGQRLHRAQGDELSRRARPAAAPARPAALAAAAAEQRRRGVGRPGREPPRHAGAVRPGRRRRRAEGLRGAGRGAPT